MEPGCLVGLKKWVGLNSGWARFGSGKVWVRLEPGKGLGRVRFGSGKVWVK